MGRLHGFDDQRRGNAVPPPPSLSGANLCQAEMETMISTFLGDDYDRERVLQVLSAQRLFHREQQRLLAGWHAGELAAPEYVRQVNEAMRLMFSHCADVLGPEDFERLFDCKPGEAHAEIDLETFLASHQ